MFNWLRKFLFGKFQDKINDRIYKIEWEIYELKILTKHLEKEKKIKSLEEKIIYINEEIERIKNQ